VRVVAGQAIDAWGVVVKHRTVRLRIDVMHYLGDGLWMRFVRDVDDPRQAMRRKTQGTCALPPRIAIGRGAACTMLVREDQVGTPVDGHREGDLRGSAIVPEECADGSDLRIWNTGLNVTDVHNHESVSSGGGG